MRKPVGKWEFGTDRARVIEETRTLLAAAKKRTEELRVAHGKRREAKQGT